MRTTMRLLAIAAVTVFAGSAQAALNLDLFVSDGDTDGIACESGGCTSITIAPGGSVVFDVFITVGSEGISSLGYDVVAAALSSVSTQRANASISVPYGAPNCPSTDGSDCNLSQLAVPGPIGSNVVTGFNIATTGVGPNSGTFRIGRVTFTFNDNTNVNVAAAVGFNNELPGQPLSIISGGGVLVTVPEPGTVALLGLGIFGLAFAGRRRA